MRLSHKEVHLIHKTLNEYLKEIAFKVFLFGSRADMNKKGGDIDLLLICDPQDYEKIVDQKYIIKSELEYALDDQRVDLTIATNEKMQTDVFLQFISNSLIEI